MQVQVQVEMEMEMEMEVLKATQTPTLKQTQKRDVCSSCVPGNSSHSSSSSSSNVQESNHVNDDNQVMHAGGDVDVGVSHTNIDQIRRNKFM
jgi:hypothetical protein